MFVTTSHYSQTLLRMFIERDDDTAFMRAGCREEQNSISSTMWAEKNTQSRINIDVYNKDFFLKCSYFKPRGLHQPLKVHSCHGVGSVDIVGKGWDSNHVTPADPVSRLNDRKLILQMTEWKAAGDQTMCLWTTHQKHWAPSRKRWNITEQRLMKSGGLSHLTPESISEQGQEFLSPPRYNYFLCNVCDV